MPCIIAFKRDHEQRGSILTLNILLGWSFLGWVAALVWSMTAVPERQELPSAAAAGIRGPTRGPPVDKLPSSSQTGAEVEPDDDIVQRPEDVIQDAVNIISWAVENSHTRTIRWRDAGQLLDQGIRRRASKAGILNLAGDSLTAAIEQGLLMLLDHKAPDARVARTSQPLPALGSPDTAAEPDEDSENQETDQADTETAAANQTETAAAPELETAEQDPKLLENLEALIRMHERGVLSDAELEAAKGRLLG